MSRVNPRGEEVRRYILANVEKHPDDISRVTAEKFQITRQAVNKHLQRLTEENVLTQSGNTKSRTYRLCPLVTWDRQYENSRELAEDLVWSNDIRKALAQMPENVLNIWHYGFTEIFNNAIDHSQSKKISVFIQKNAASTEMIVMDEGIGIFKKIQLALGLLDERHAIFELAKGKLTTDPRNHTGEGIFFSSRMFDQFSILSGGVYFDHEYGKPEDWLVELAKAKSGTTVFMRLHNHTSRTSKKVFDSFTTEGDNGYGFTKTVVPVKLAMYGNDQLISRSQAKRLLARVELFKTVIFDFSDITEIGQAFADEIFRVFSNQHPEIKLVSFHETENVRKMIARAKASNIKAVG